MLVKEMRTAFTLLAALLIAGCQAQAARPNFLARSFSDCANGDQPACTMLGSLNGVSSKSSQGSVDQRPRTQVEKDADAIMEGMRRARSSAPAQNLRMAPTIKRNS